METTGDAAAHRLRWVERWPTETPLAVLVAACALGIWVLLAVSIFGLVYAVLIGVFLFVTHLAFIAYVRGSAVRLGPDQMPDLFRRVEELARRVGLRRTPAVYLMQAGGALNALATKFLATEFVVLFSDLLDACGDDQNARDMIIGHELGHLREGHLRWMWFLLPGMFTPFLGSAYSRAREYTCDRYGAAVCADRTGALRGLAILAAGGRQGPRVNLQALARQREDLNTAWMTIGRWLATHPPVAHRIAALDPGLAGGPRSLARGPAGALAILGSLFAVPLAGGLVFALTFWPQIQERLQAQGSPEMSEGMVAEPPLTFPEEEEAPPVQEGPRTVVDLFGVPFATEVVHRDLAALGKAVEEFRTASGALPASIEEVRVVWQELRPGEPFPVDPFDGYWYGYTVEEERFQVWSAGPDPNDPEDDIRYLSVGGDRT